MKAAVYYRIPLIGVREGQRHDLTLIAQADPQVALRRLSDALWGEATFWDIFECGPLTIVRLADPAILLITPGETRRASRTDLPGLLEQSVGPLLPGWAVEEATEVEAS